MKFHLWNRTNKVMTFKTGEFIGRMSIHHKQQTILLDVTDEVLNHEPYLSVYHNTLNCIVAKERNDDSPSPCCPFDEDLLRRVSFWRNWGIRKKTLISAKKM